MSNTILPKIVAVVGATATGKSEFAIKLAQDFSGEIISADSVQVYKHLDIGSGKIDLAGRKGINHHLVSIIELSQEFNSALFKKKAEKVVAQIIAKGNLPIVCGSAMLYIKCLVHGIVPTPEIPLKIKNQVEKLYKTKGSSHCLDYLKELVPNYDNNFIDPQRIKRALAVAIYTGKSLTQFQRSHLFKNKQFDCLYLQVNPSTRSTLYSNINERVDNMLKKGLIDEVKNLLSNGISSDIRALQSIGYKQAVEYLQGKIELDNMQKLIKQKTRNYAKRQLTWYRAQKDIHLVSSYNQEVKQIVQKFIQSKEDNKIKPIISAD